ncbi:MAG: PAS domain-containing sensor histidine kinase, partial [Planctomycetota bacterium]
VSVPMAPIQVIARGHALTLSVGHFVLWLLGVGGIGLGGQRLKQRIQERKYAEEQIEGLAKFPSENPNPVLRVTKDGILLYANTASESLLAEWGCEIGQTVPEDWRQMVSEAFASNSAKRVEKEHAQRTFSFVFAPVIEADYVNLYGRDITDRKQVLEALWKAEEKYRTLTESSLTGIFIQQDGRYVFVNDRFAEIHGFKPEDLLQKEYRSLIHPEEGEFVAQRIAKRLEGEEVQQRYETRRLKKDGQTIWCEMMASRIEYMDRPAIMGNIIDITERKQAEEQIRKLSRAVEQSPNTVLITDTEGNIEYVNPKFTQLTGYSLDEVIGRNPNILKSGETPREEYERLWDTISSGGEWRGEFHNKKKNGELYWESASISPVRDLDGVITHFIAVKEDITERKQTEEALWISEANYHTIFDSANDAIFVHDVETGKILNVNQKSCEMFGYTEDELKKLSVEDISTAVPPYTQENAIRWIKKAVNIGPQLFEWICKDKKGKNFWVEVNLKAAVIEGQDRMLAIVRDITERKNAEEDLRKYREHLEELVQTRTAELTEANKKLLQEIEGRKRLEKEILDISERERRRIGQELHDSLGQQLTGIAFMTKVLEQNLAKKLPDESDVVAEISQLVNQATDQARDLAKGLHPIDLHTGTLMSALQELAESTEHLFGVHCTFECDKPIPMDDAQVVIHLYRITQEAVTNAIKHGGAKNINIGLTYGKKESVLTVKNDGVDFPKKFEKRGTGMGLQIMDHRVDIIGGSLDIHKAPKGGTIVTCTFPNKK